MKKERLFLSGLMLLIALSGFSQTTIMVEAGTDVISGALATAVPGDIIELSTDGGLYHESATVMIADSITIQAAAGLFNKPVWTSDSDSSLIELSNDLNLTGVMLDGAGMAEIAFYPNDGVLGYELVVENCDFTNFGTGVIAGRETTQAELVSFNNCLITNMGHKAIAFNTTDIAPAAVRNLSVTNSTFMHIGDDVIAVYPYESDVSVVGFVVDQVTFYDIADKGIYPSHILNPLITNCIASNPGNLGTNFFYLYAGSTIQNSLYWNFPGGHMNGVAENIFNADPMFVDPANGDLTLMEGSPAIDAGTAGLSLGDPRWWPGTVIEVAAGTDVISAALATASPRDIIELTTDGGTYHESGTLVIDSPVTIRSAADLANRPTLSSDSDSSMFIIYNHLTLTGVILDGLLGSAQEDLAFDPYDAAGLLGYKLIVENCEITNFTTGVIAGREGTQGERVSFDNCLITNMGDKAIAFNTTDIAPAAVRSLSVTNSTFMNIGDDVIAVYPYESGVSTIEFVVDHVTFYDVDDKGIYPSHILYPMITNCIASNPTALGTNFYYLYDGSTIQNSLYWNFPGGHMNGIAENIINADPMFTDAANGDLTLMEGSPALDGGINGTAMGDPRWWPAAYVVIQVPAGTDAISEALTLAEPGNTLELVTDGGIYHESATLMINEPVTIRAAADLDNKPVLTSDSDSSMIQIFNHLNLKGVVMDAAAGANVATIAIDPYGPEALQGYKLVVEDCDFTDFSENVIVGREGTQAELVSFNNCLITNIGGKAIAFNTTDIAPGSVVNLSVTNSTFINIGDDAIAAYPTVSGESVVNFLVDQVTFYDLGDKGVYPQHIAGDVLITNCIASNPSSLGSRCYYLYDPAVFMNSLYWNFDGTHFGGSYGTAENIINADPMFADPANGDLTLMEGSPAINAGTDGLSIGDPRWWPPVHVTVEVAAGTDAISAALAMDADAMTIILTTDGGIYEESSTLFIEKPVNLIMAEGLTERPTLISGAAGAMIEISDDFFIEGVVLDGSLGAALSATGITNKPNTMDYDLTVLNTDFLNFVDASGGTGFGIFGNVSSVIDSFYIQDSYFAHILNKGISFKDPLTATGSVNYFEVDNCTFWDMNSEAIYVDGFDSDVDTPDPEFLVNKVTAYDCGSYNIIPHYMDGAVITNSMVVLPEMNTGYAPAKIYGAHSRIENFLYYNTRDIDLSSGATDFQLINVVVQEDPLLTDPDNGDFSYPENSPAYLTVGGERVPIGDDRWWFLLPVGVDNADEQIPMSYLLGQNYPNPFNPTTLIDFQLPEAGHVSLVIHDVLGREVNHLINGEMQPGYYQTSWNGLTNSGTIVSGGVYFYTIRSGSFVQTKKMLYLK